MGIATTLDITPAQRKQVLALISQYLPNTTVWAFGSRVKFTAKPSSDLDLVAFSTPVQKSNLVELREAFEESDLPFSVDILDWNSIPNSFKTNIRELYVVMAEQKEQQTKEGWKTYKLRNITTKIGSGATPRGGKDAYLATGEYSLIRSQNILDFAFSYNGLAFINKEQAAQLNNVTIEERDVLLNITGDSVARVCQVPKDVLPARVNQHVAIIRPDSSKLSPEFLKYYLLNPSCKNQLLSFSAVGATRNALTKGMIEDIDILLPTINEQQRIASILSSLDDKIELNRQTNQTLETLAQTLFQEICVPKGDEFPEGWRLGKLDDLIDTVSVTHKMKQEEIIFLNTSDILEGNVLNDSYSVVSTLPGQAKKSIKRNDILFSEIRPANKRYAFVNFDADDYVVSTKLMVLRSKGEISTYLIYCYLTSNDTLKQLQHLAETRSGTFPQITFTQLKDLEILIPAKAELDKLTNNIQSIYENIFSNSKENQTLIALRDSLLPKLMKGEIEI